MKKIFNEHEYPDTLIEEVSEWIKEQTIKSNGTLRVYSPVVIVELFNRDGKPLK